MKDKKKGKEKRGGNLYCKVPTKSRGNAKSTPQQIIRKLKSDILKPILPNKLCKKGSLRKAMYSSQQPLITIPNLPFEGPPTILKHLTKKN